MHTLKSLLHKIYEMDKERDSICYLFILNGVHDRRTEIIFQNVCDVMFEIEVEKKGDKMGKASIPKIRGTPPILEDIRFKVSDRLHRYVPGYRVVRRPHDRPRASESPRPCDDGLPVFLSPGCYRKKVSFIVFCVSRLAFSRASASTVRTAATIPASSSACDRPDAVVRLMPSRTVSGATKMLPTISERHVIRRYRVSMHTAYMKQP